MRYENRFDSKADIYEKARPKYALGLFDYFKNTLKIPDKSIFADIGSGTGIFTEQLLECGYKVFAVEPNDDMRKKAEEKLKGNKNFTSVKGNDAHTGLAENSVDYVSVAEAFHWLDPEAFRSECRRILKPGGKVMIIYNWRVANASCTKALAVLRHKYNPEFHGYSNGMSREKCIDFFAGKYEEFRSDNTQIYDLQGYIDRALSSSYSLKEGDDRYSEYMKEIVELFNTFSTDGHIVIPTETVAYVGTV